MGRFPKPCIRCGALTTGGSYCAAHQAIKQGLYNNLAYRRQREYIRATATHCHICKEAFIDRKDISADHIIPGDPNSPLLPAHIACNSRRGDKPIP
jgi:hypothetical protein